MAIEKQAVRQEAQEKGKVPRVPFGTAKLKMQLSAADEAGFKQRGKVLRWFNGKDGRIERALAAGYSFVDPKYVTSLGQSALHQGNTDEGSKVSMIVSRGEHEIRAYLMEIEKKFYDEDQAAKAARLVESEKADPVEADGESGITYGSGVTFSH